VSKLLGLCLALLLSLPVWSWAQQSAAPSGAASQSQQALPDPVLAQRPPAKSPAQRSVTTAESRIHLDVVVTDAAGKPALGFAPSDFTLLDNNQPRKILSFRSFDGVAVKPTPPVEVILLFDAANLSPQQTAFTRQQIGRFLRQNGGHLALPVYLFLLTDAGLRMHPRPSTDGNALAAMMDQIDASVHTINPAMGAEGDLMRFQLSVRQLTAIAENEAARPGRKLLIWVGPGWPMLDSANFTHSEKDQRRYFNEIVALSTKLREARMVVYSVAPSSSVTGSGTHTLLYQAFLKGVKSPRQADTGNLGLKVLAVQTGGRILGPDNDLAAQINSCMAEANAFYTLSFNPPPAENADEYHELKIQVGQAGFAARTTTGYYNQP
jgi:VWFA-related protein